MRKSLKKPAPMLIILLAGLLSGCAAARALPGSASNQDVLVADTVSSVAAKDLSADGCQLDLPGELFDVPEEQLSSPAPPQTPGKKLPATLDPGERVVQIARQFVGVPYRKGGASSAGFDCSGLVFYAYRQLGVTIPRTSASQHQAAQTVSLDSLRTGDLLFFKIKPQRVSHVGIYVEDDLFLHAPSSGKNVTYSRLGEPYWKKRLVGAGRLAVE